MPKMDLYFIGKNNIMAVVFDLYNHGFSALPNRPLIFDCGCGIGTYAYNLLSKARYVGLDVNLSSIKLAHKNHPEGMFIIGDAGKLPFKSNAFDGIICSEVLEHIVDDEAVLRELARVTRPNAKLIVTVPNLLCKDGFVKLQRSLIDVPVGHYREGYSASEISKLLVDLGFDLQQVKYNCGPFTAIVEYAAIKTARRFGYDASNRDELLIDKPPITVRIALGIYRLLFPLIILFTHLDKLVHCSRRSNIAILAVRSRKNWERGWCS
jgi:SAM-dependent methyltransferase